MSISTIIMAVAVVIEFIAAVGSMKLYKEVNEQKEWLNRENDLLKRKEEALLEAIANARRKISKLHKRNRRSGKHGNI